MTMKKENYIYNNNIMTSLTNVWCTDRLIRSLKFCGVKFIMCLGLSLYSYNIVLYAYGLNIYDLYCEIPKTTQLFILSKINRPNNYN